MAARKSRYTEARLYAVAGSVGLLLIVWSVLANQDSALFRVAAGSDNALTVNAQSNGTQRQQTQTNSQTRGS